MIQQGIFAALLFMAAVRIGGWNSVKDFWSLVTAAIMFAVIDFGIGWLVPRFLHIQHAQLIATLVALPFILMFLSRLVSGFEVRSLFKALKVTVCYAIVVILLQVALTLLQNSGVI
ncbi:MAG: hypothetical protein FWC85_02860 [Elusimicrobia bacterium]|nr:hypothetical protein [Elusimicrobiota bacterium]